MASHALTTARSRPRRAGVVTAVCLAVLGFVTVGFASVAIPDGGTGTVHACQNKATGVLRLVDPALGGTLGHCIATAGLLQEKEVSWGQAGPAGPQGVRGSAGPQGSRGDTGPQGLTGPAGGLSCADEARIKAAAPSFELSSACVPPNPTPSGWRSTHRPLWSSVSPSRSSSASPRRWTTTSW